MLYFKVFIVYVCDDLVFIGFGVMFFYLGEFVDFGMEVEI